MKFKISFPNHKYHPLLVFNLSSSEVHEKLYEIYTNAGLLKNRVNKNDWKNCLKRVKNRAHFSNSNFSLWGMIQKAPFPTNDRWYNVLLNVLAYLQASASVSTSLAGLVTQADGQLFDMYNGFSEAYAHTLANRRYGTLADDLFDQNFVEIKSTAVEGAHSIYIETWRSFGVVDVESTTPKSGLIYDLWDTRQDLVNGEAGQFDVPNVQWSFIGSTGLGGSGGNSSPQFFIDWRYNLQNVIPAQNSSIQQLFSYYQ